ncbi:hypothetical protein ACFR9U_10170 [Halorientalis brevis]|uniref:Class I SAM-dependent methyltransferase n=1 Tax=Halorientalis brevis TaxID=1126241 RepID=A0ABD6CAF5_9EURY|nr:class I SAM-dependent methyltransferase [Halorientalis brevis]
MADTPASYSMQEYLTAKRSVDDRALNRRVLDRVTTFLDERDAPDVLEVGAGTGAMVARALAWDLLPDGTAYTAIEIDPDSVALARETVRAAARAADYRISEQAAEEVRLVRDDREITVTVREADAFAFVERAERTWDLLIGAAFADLVGASAVERLLGAVPDGACYFPITFDGMTRFHPAADPAFDALIERRYHATMNDGALGSQAGRRLVSELKGAGWDVPAVGGADWTIHPTGGTYPEGEGYVLHYLLETIASAVDDQPDVDGERLEQWLTRRHRQVTDGELLFVAHNLDVFGQHESNGDRADAA